jgi:hypothetical protein
MRTPSPPAHCCTSRRRQHSPRPPARVSPRSWEDARRCALVILDQLWDYVEVIEVGQALVEGATELAHRCALRSYDAVHWAAEQAFAAPNFVVAAGDRRPLEVWHAIRVATYDVDQPG